MSRATEAQCQDAIIQAATIGGYMIHAERPANTSRGYRTPIQGHPGWPDLVLIGDTALIFAELKRRPNKLEDNQIAWLNQLGRFTGLSNQGFGPRIHVAVWWVPDDLAVITQALAAGQVPRPPTRDGTGKLAA